MGFSSGAINLPIVLLLLERRTVNEGWKHPIDSLRGGQLPLVYFYVETV